MCWPNPAIKGLAAAMVRCTSGRERDVAGLVFPGLGDPQRIAVGGIQGEDVAYAAGHLAHLVQQQVEEGVTLPRPCPYLTDEAIHRRLS